MRWLWRWFRGGRKAKRAPLAETIPPEWLDTKASVGLGGHGSDWYE